MVKYQWVNRVVRVGEPQTIDTRNESFGGPVNELRIIVQSTQATIDGATYNSGTVLEYRGHEKEVIWQKLPITAIGNGQVIIQLKVYYA